MMSDDHRLRLAHAAQQRLIIIGSPKGLLALDADLLLVAARTAAEVGWVTRGVGRGRGSCGVRQGRPLHWVWGEGRDCARQEHHSIIVGQKSQGGGAMYSAGTAALHACMHATCMTPCAVHGSLTLAFPRQRAAQQPQHSTVHTKAGCMPPRELLLLPAQLASMPHRTAAMPELTGTTPQPHSG